MQTAVFGGGCFWCTEAVFADLEGVHAVVPGYCGGSTESPTYEEVCTKDTGHIEVIRIEYDDTRISFDTLLDVFFATHDPTTPNRQGNDVGPQYQSVIFAQTPAQAQEAVTKIRNLDADGHFGSPIVTVIRDKETFWPAESIHHNYYSNNPHQGYCQFVIAPKMQHLHRSFGNLLKK